MTESFELQKWAYRLNLHIPDEDVSNIFLREIKKIKNILDKKKSLNFTYKIVHICTN